MDSIVEHPPMLVKGRNVATSHKIVATRVQKKSDGSVTMELVRRDFH